MTSRGKASGVGLLLCALAVCAFGAASAHALGLTAVKCVEAKGKEGHYNPFCHTPKGIAGDWETVQLAGSTEIEGAAEAGSTEKPSAIFSMSVAGLAITVTCGTDTLSTGSLTNAELGEGMVILGTKLVTSLKECHASLKSDPTKKCLVQGTAPATAAGTLETNSLKTLAGPEHTLTTEPESGTTFTEFRIIGGAAPCFTKMNTPVNVTGQLKGEVPTEEHSHLTFTLGKSGTGTKANGVTATFETTVDVWMKGNPNDAVGGQTD